MSTLENYVHDNLEGSDNNKLNDDALRLSQKEMRDIQIAARQREDELNQLLKNQNQRNEQGEYLSERSEHRVYGSTVV